MAMKCGVSNFAVFSAHEAYDVYRATGGECEVMIMGMVDNGSIEWTIEKDISFYLFDLHRLNLALEASKKLKKPARIHLELETGMNRTGFNKKDLLRAIEIILRNPESFVVEGVCTHYAGAESIANYHRVRHQIHVFKAGYKLLKKEGIEPKIRHTACSAASVSYPTTLMDMARIGILQYGFWPSRETTIKYLNKSKKMTNPLKRVITWRSTVMSMKSVSAGEFIGYGTTYLAETDMRVAAVPVGYADGYSRSLSNQGRVLINGHRVGVVGIVNMNMMLVDITRVPDVREGDDVFLIGSQDGVDLSVSSFAELSDQLNYELLTRLPRHIPRIKIK
jgi:alanine racemase